MRVLVAALMGGIVMFLWGAIAHMALGLGDVGMRPAANEDVVLSALHPGLGDRPGVFLVPSIDPAKMSDKAAMDAYAAKSTTSPYAFLVYLPQGEDMTKMGGRIPRQWASDTLSALILAAVMALGAFGFGKRMAIALAAPVFAWLSVLVPYWNWYLFPGALTWAALADQLIGWLLAGAVMAWWLGRAERKAAA